MNEKEIEKTLKKYKQSYAPWELDNGNCPMYYDSDLVEFGKEMYEKGKSSSEDIALKFHLWCLNQKSLEYFKDYVLWRQKEYTIKQFFDYFVNNVYGKND